MATNSLMHLPRAKLVLLLCGVSFARSP